jgi:Lon-like ATP-dependent protease
VLIPTADADRLMLRPDVVAAVTAGRFNVWAVESVDAAIELLTGVPAGERDDAGTYPPESVNGRAEARLRVLADAARDLARPRRAKGRAKDRS